MNDIEFCCLRGHGTVDIVADSYTCLIKKRGGPLQIFAEGSDMADLILSPDAGFDAAPGGPLLETELDTFSGRVEKKELVWRCGENVRVRLTFLPDRIELKANFSGEKRRPERFYLGRGSKLFSERIFTPSWPDLTLPIGHYLHPCEPVELSPGLMSPSPWCFCACGQTGGWMSFSLEPNESELDFSEFGSVPGNGNDYCWSVGYKGCQTPRSELSAPALVLRFGLSDEFEGFARHARTLLKSGKVCPPRLDLPGWHRGVSVCGWCWQNSRRDSCTQKIYEDNLRLLEAKGLDYDILTIDDFWGDPQKHGVWRCDEANWPDLRGFIDARHDEGRHVLLWLCTYSTGLPDGERRDGVLNELRSPEWAERLRCDAHRMLSSDEGCYNADGIKYDYTALFPEADEADEYRGVGYIRERFRMVYEAMTEVKPDAMIVCQSMNPYFNRYQTAIRLNDFTALPRQGLEEMRIRSRIARAVGGGLPIDTDHVSFSTYPYDGGYDFFREMDKLGEISLYVNERDLSDPVFCDILREQISRRLVRK